MRGTVVLALLLVTGCGDDGAAPNGPPVDAQRSDGPVSDANRDAPAAIDAPLGDARPADAAIDRPPLPDSSIGDGGMFATPVTPDEVACPQSDGGACMTPAFKCCGHNVRIDCAPASTTCNLVDQACDGQEDCPGIIAQVCCGMGTPPMTITTRCMNTSCPSGWAQVCHNHTQCPSAAPWCCRRSANSTSGVCFPPHQEGPGLQCDVP